MPRDYDIRRMNKVDGWSKEHIADMLGHDINSVRGRISRASLGERVRIAQELAERQPLINTGVERQKAVIARGAQAFFQKQAALQQRGTMATVAFISDLHIPYTHWPAVELALHILEAAQPDYITSYNDLWDMTGYGRWPDARSPASMLWSDDISNALAVSAELHDAYHKAAPKATLLQLAGNHDLWLFNHLRTVSRTGFSEHNVAEFMEAVEAQGVLHFTAGENKHENVIQLSPGLKLVHGVSAAKNPAGQTSQALQERGVFFHTVAGHTHRSGATPVNGVMHYNAGCLCTHDPAYLKHAPHWDTGIVLVSYDPNSRFVRGEVIDFIEWEDRLVAHYAGIDFTVPIA